MSTAEDLRTFVLTESDITDVIGTRMYENTVPGSTTTLPFVWYRMARREFAGVLGQQESKPWQEFYDVECVSDDLDQAHDLAELVRLKLDAHYGTMGSGTYAWVHVLDQYEDYVPRNIEADEHLQIVSLQIEVFNSGFA